MYYDQDLFQKFRALAVTDPLQLVPGWTYYSNAHPLKFKVKEVISGEELARRNRWDTSPTSDYEKKQEELAWIVYDADQYCSLKDRNIGDSYNPWLVFESEALAEACKAMLKIDYNRGPVSALPEHQVYSYRGFFVKAWPKEGVVKVSSCDGCVVNWVKGAEGKALKQAFDWIDQQLYKPQRLCDLDLKPGDKIVYQNAATGNRYPYVVPKDVKGFILSCSPLPCWTKE